MSAHLRYGVPSKVLSVRVPADKYVEMKNYVDQILAAYERRVNVIVIIKEELPKCQPQT